MSQKLCALFMIVLLVISGCGGGGGSSPAPVEPSAYTMEEEIEFSESYTDLGVSYYELLVRFNQFAGTLKQDTEAEEEYYARWESKLTNALEAAERARDAHEVVADFEFSSAPAEPAPEPTEFNGEEWVSMMADDSVATARNLMKLWESGDGPARLTLSYISEKTGKSIDFLFHLLDQIKNEKENWDNDNAEQLAANAERSSEFVRDASLTAVSAIAMAATGPAVVAGGVTKATTVAAKAKQVFDGAKVVFQSYQAGKTLENTVALGSSLIISVGTNDIPPKVATLSEAIVDKLNLSKAETAVSFFSGVNDVISGNIVERVTGLVDVVSTFLPSASESPKVYGFTLEKDGSKIIETPAENDDLENYSVYANENENLAAQLGAGTYNLSYLENTAVSTVEGDSAEDNDGSSESEILFKYDANTNETTVSTKDDFMEVKVPGRVELRGDNGDFDREYNKTVTVQVKKEVLTVAADTNGLAEDLIAASEENIKAKDPVSIDSSEGPYSGHYVCSGEAQGACEFTVNGSYISGWVDFDADDPEVPVLNYGGNFNQDTGTFRVYGPWNAMQDGGIPVAGTFSIESRITPTLTGLMPFGFKVWENYEDGQELIDAGVLEDGVSITKR